MEKYVSAEFWQSQADVRKFMSEEARLEYLREGVQQAVLSGDRDGEVFLRLAIVGRLLDRGAKTDAEREMEQIALPDGDRSYSPVRYATFCQELGRLDDALRALRVGFEDERPSDLTLYDAEQYKVRRLRRVRVAHQIGGNIFGAEILLLAKDLFGGIRIPLRDLDPIKGDVLGAIADLPWRPELALLTDTLTRMEGGAT